MKYSYIIRTSFYGNIYTTQTCMACKWVTTTYNFYELEIALESDIETDILLSKIIILLRSVTYTIVTNHTLSKCDCSFNNL